MRRATIIGISAGAAVLVAAAGLAGWGAVSRASSPASVVTAYLEALEGGDAERAVALLADPPAQDVVAAYRGAVEAISDPRVVTADTAAGAGNVDVSFVLDGTTHQQRIGVVDTAGGWRLTGDGLGFVTIDPALGDSVVVGDALLGADAPLVLFPAVYEVRAAPAGLVDGSATATILTGDNGGISLPGALRPEATAHAQAQLDVYADACAAAAPAVPDACGLVVPWAADLVALDEIGFAIETYPVVTFSDDARTYRASGGSIVATATGETPAGDTASFTYRSDDWTLHGTVTFRGDTMQLSVR